MESRIQELQSIKDVRYASSGRWIKALAFVGILMIVLASYARTLESPTKYYILAATVSALLAVFGICMWSVVRLDKVSNELDDACAENFVNKYRRTNPDIYSDPTDTDSAGEVAFE